jgi:hypothetical protein
MLVPELYPNSIGGWTSAREGQEIVREIGEIAAVQLLGQCYRSPRGLDHRARKYSHPSTPHLSPKTYIDLTMKRPHSSLSDKMHLRNGEHVSNFSGAPEEHVAKKVQSNGASKTLEQAATRNGGNEALHTNGHSSKTNEIRARNPSDLTPDAVLNTVLAAWSILIHRYQRDVFHQFTWGAVGGQGRASQCINTTDLNFTNHQTARSLKSQISHVRSKEHDAHNATLFLNDGSPHEVLSTQAFLWHD